MFNRLVFNEVDSIKNHKNVLSGDDQYLLNDFIRHKKRVGVTANSELLVTTFAPIHLISALKQRVRRIGKTTKIDDRFSQLIAQLMLVIQFLFLYLFIALVIHKMFGLLSLIFVIKLIAEHFVFKTYFRKINQIGALNYSWLITTFYPIYILGLLILILVWKPDWKGRK